MALPLQASACEKRTMAPGEKEQKAFANERGEGARKTAAIAIVHFSCLLGKETIVILLISIVYSVENETALENYFSHACDLDR